MAITDWPIGERPREKLLSIGAKSLNDAELLAIFLRTGTKGVSAVEMARNLLSEYGSLRALFSADYTRFSMSHGLGEAKYVQLQAVLEMSRRYLSEQVKRGLEIDSAEVVKEYLKAELRAYHHEVFACLFMDNRHRVIEFRELFAGTIDSASVYPREVVRQALQYNSAAVIFAHNHPSGVAEPSSADISITKRLQSALDLIDVRVLDHIIIGDDVVSMAERGLL